jgi:putative peptidoglycan lipid II flippase
MRTNSESMFDIIKKTSNIFIAKQKGVFAAALVISVMAIFAKVFGLIRLRVFSYYFTPADLDIYLASFRIPDFLFDTIFSGAIATAFIPIYSKYVYDKVKLSQTVSSIINSVFIFVTTLSVILFIFMHYIMSFILPGFNEVQINQTVYYARMLLLGQLPFFILGNFLVGIGQANKIFLPSAVAPVIYNCAIIVVTVLFASKAFLMAPIIGVIIGAILFFIVQLPVIRKSDYVYQLGIPSISAVREFITLVVPRTLTIIAHQIDVFVDLTLASLLGSGMYTIFYLSQHLMLLPVSVIGYAYGQASLPFLTELYATGKKEEFKKLIVSSILNLLFIAIPIAGFLIIARTPAVRLVFGGSEFNFGKPNVLFDTTTLTALTVSYFAVSLPFHTLYYFILRVYYAMNDAKTPFIVSAFSIALNTICSVVFVQVLHYKVYSLAAAFSIAITFNVLTLLFILRKRLVTISSGLIAFQTTKIIIATGISMIFGYYILRIFDNLILNTDYTINVLILMLVAGSSYILVYFLSSLVLGLHSIEIFSKAANITTYRKKMQEVISITENN